MATNIRQYNVSHWRKMETKGELDKSYSRLDVYDRLIEKVSTRSELSVGDAALRYTCGYLDSATEEVKAEKFEVVLWTQEHEDAVNSIQTDGTLSP